MELFTLLFALIHLGKDRETRSSLSRYCYIAICRFTSTSSHAYTCRIDHNNTIIKNERSLLYKNMYLSLYCKVWKGYSRFYCERELETEQKLQYFDLTFMAISVVFFSFSWCSNRGPGGLTLLAFSTTSYQQLLWTPTHQVPKGPFRRASLPHLVF